MRAAARVSAALAVALLAGCSGGSASGRPGPASTTSGAGTSTGTSTGTSAGEAAALLLRARATTMGKGSSRIDTAVASSTGVRTKSTGVYNFRTGDADAKVTTTTSGRTTTSRVLVVRGYTYASLPGAIGNGRYLKLKAPLTAATGMSNQGTQLQLLLGTPGSLHKIGSESVRGVSTAHFAGTVDQAKAIAAIKDPKQRAALAKLRAIVKTPDLIPVEVWVDQDGLLRRLSERVTIAAQKVSGVAVPASTVTTTQEFYDYGVPVHVTAPPAAKIYG